MSKKLQPRFCEEVNKTWDIERMFSDLVEIKGLPLDPPEKERLCLLIARHSPTEIGKIIHMTPESVRSYLSTTLYKYVKKKLQKELSPDEFKRISENWDWKDIRIFADDYYRNYGEDFLVDSEQLPPVIGWIWLGAIDKTLEDKPSAGMQLRTMGNQPVTIFPCKVPTIRSKVTVISPVNLRVQMPYPPSYALRDCKFIRQLLTGSQLVVLDLGGFVDRSAGSDWTRVWAKVGECLS